LLLNTQGGEPEEAMKNEISLICRSELANPSAQCPHAPPIPGEQRGESNQRTGGGKPGLRAVFCAACLFIPRLLGAQDFSLDWFAVAAGGGESSGGDFELSATIGEPATGDMAGVDFAISGGFWNFVETPADLALKVSLASGNVVISWLQNGSAGFALEETAALAHPTTTWAAVNVAPQASNGTNRVQLPLASGNRFYRLHKP